MIKIFNWAYNNVLFAITLFLLAFIPLYPKKPLIDVVNTWVYVRLEDFVIVSVLLIWLALLFRKKITLKTPLTMPILLFWIVGAISTIHGVLLIFPSLANVFPNVALLSFLRRVEYLSLFFVSFAAIKDKKMLPYIVTILTLTLFAVVFYGIGQRYAEFPAYLTMNEEFAKGEPIRLSALSRVPSTFGGHYDLAAYLVLIIPIMASLFFGVKNLFLKLIFLLAVGSGLILLYLTISRVSFFVIFITLFTVLFFYKKRWVFFSLPIVILIAILFFINLTPRLLDRFGNTIKEVDVLVDAKTGVALGNIKEISLANYQDTIVTAQNFGTINEDVPIARKTTATPSAMIIPFYLLPPQGVLLVPPNVSTGENLPQGTGYVNLILSPIKRQISEFFYEKRVDGTKELLELQMFRGQFLIKKAYAYDLSLTTRYQGEWPHAIEAFKRNIFLGSGYSSISLAVDNSYLRMLGEVGLIGFTAFLVIFVSAAAYIKQVLPNISSPLVRSFVVGFSAGVFGLILNATLIDVFEASKVAFYLWLLAGITIGLIHLHQTKPFALYSVLKKVAVSTYMVVLYLVCITFFIYSPMLNNFFVGDDFTWFRWAEQGGINLHTIGQYFTQSDGFFYRPGSKLYFLLMYSVFWLNPFAYHFVSLTLHAIVVVLVFILVKKILRNFSLSVLAAFFFAFLSSYHEAIFWISSVGHLFSTMFVLLSVLFFSLWDERKNIIYFILSLTSILLSLMFHELGVIAPIFIIFYKFVQDGLSFANLKLKKWYYIWSFFPVVLYLIVRYLSNSHWFSGDYNYNLFKLPFNIIGNFSGYLLVSSSGPLTISFYETVRNISRDHLLFSVIIIGLLIGMFALSYRFIKRINKEDKRIIIAGIGFMVIALLPFLGLGNITSRYNYLVSFGFVILFVFVIKKLYSFLISNGRDITFGVMSLVVGLFFLLHIIQVQKIHGDWHDAGLKVKMFFTSTQGIYQNNWGSQPMIFNFVNIPIRNRDAWVFPVGLEDALWFSFRNSQITVQKWNSVDEALKSVKDPLTEKVFLFDDSGVVTEQTSKKPIK